MQNAQHAQNTPAGEGARPESGAPPGSAAGTDVGPPPGVHLELLVHGVGGTTPQEMLGDPRVERVTGDLTAAVYRSPDDVDAESRPEDYRDRPVPEAYSWSNLTSGNGARALWLILLPFMVANLAHWMRPADHSPRLLPARAHGVLMRLLALTLTVLLVAAACEVALDLVAWQCAGSHRCAAERSWLEFMAVGPDGTGGWWSQPGRRLALAAVLPVAMTLLLWWLSHRTWSAYESQRPLRSPVDEYAPEAQDLPPLCLPGFWYGKRLVARLRAAHTAAGFLTVAAAVAGAAARHDRGEGGGAAPAAVGALTEALVVACVLWVLYVVVRRGRKHSRPDDAADAVTVRGLPLAAAGVLLLAVLYACWPRPGWVSHGQLPGDQTFGVLVVLQGLLVAAVAVLGHVLHRRGPARRTALHGTASAAVALLACALGGVLTGGIAQRVGDWLDGPGTPGTGNGLIPGPPTLLAWQSSAIPVLLLAVLVLLLCFLVQVSRRSRRLMHDVERDYPDALPDVSRTRRIASTVARAALTDASPWLLGTVSAITLLLGAVSVLGTWRTGQVPGRAADGMPALVDGFADTVQVLGSWLVGLAVVLLLAWGRRAYQDPSARRTIGILWDVGTFWPRAAHPFSPPCYAERAVPDLAWRMAAWTQQNPGRLVISGHSQGSVLAAAAVWQLDPTTREKIALLTYGSPLERLYGRWFPAYFGPERLRDLHEQVAGWINLWRRTDPIGGPVRVGDDAVDRGPLLDPLEYGRTLQQPLPAPILGHSEYQADPVFDTERNLLLRRLRGRGGADGPGVPRQGGPAGADTSTEGAGDAARDRDGDGEETTAGTGAAAGTGGGESGEGGGPEGQTAPDRSSA